MNVYELFADSDNFQNLALSDEQEHQYINSHFLNAQPLGTGWKPLNVEVMQFKKGRKNFATLPASDYPKIGGMPVFSQRAVVSLRDMLESSGEVLPLIFEGRTTAYFAFNPTNLIEALDEQASEVKRFDDGRVMRVVGYEFELDKLNGATIFKIPQERGRIYVTDAFAQRVKEASLTGFRLIPLWSSVPRETIAV